MIILILMKLYQLVTHLFIYLGNVRDFPHIIKVNFYRIILSEHVENRTENRRKHFLIFDRISMKVFYTVMCKTGSPRNRQLFIML